MAEALRDFIVGNSSDRTSGTDLTAARGQHA
jgi:hypothetical protein